MMSILPPISLTTCFHIFFAEALVEGKSPQEALQLGFELALKERDAALRDKSQIQEERDDVIKQYHDMRKERDQALNSLSDMAARSPKISNRYFS